MDENQWKLRNHFYEITSNRNEYYGVHKKVVVVDVVVVVVVALCFRITMSPDLVLGHLLAR